MEKMTWQMLYFLGVQIQSKKFRVVKSPQNEFVRARVVCVKEIRWNRLFIKFLMTLNTIFMQ